MIKNDRQLKYSRRKIQEIREGLEAIHKKYSSDKNKVTLLSQGYIEHIAQLKGEIEEYEKIKVSPLPKALRIHDIGEISCQLARLRIARRITQAQLAARVGCKQADISRMEREDYQGYTLNQLKKIAESLGAVMEIDLIPVSR